MNSHIRCCWHKFNIAAFVCMMSLPHCANAESPEDTLDRIVAQRKAITNGMIKIESKTYKPEGNTERLESIVVYHCFFDGSQVRIDKEIRRVESDAASLLVLNDKTIRTADGSYLHHEGAPSAPSVVASVIDSGSESPNKKKYQNSTWDPRMLGLSPLHISTMYVLDDWQKIFPRDVAKPIYYNEDREIVVESGFGTQIVTIAPGALPTPKAISWLQNGKSELKIVVNSTSVNAQAGSVQFPESWSFTHKIAGDLVLRNECRVLSIDLEGAIDPDIFTLKGLELGNGHIVDVADTGLPKTMVWDGKQLNDYSESEIAFFTPDRRPLKTFVLLLSITLGVIAVVILAWKRMGTYAMSRPLK